MSHVDEGQLHAWLDGEFASTGQDEAAFEAHLENCALCLGRLDRARAEREEADRILAMASPAVVEIPPFEAVLARRESEGGDEGPEVGAGGDSRGRGGRGRRSAGVAVGWAATVVLALGIGWMARGAATDPQGSGSESSRSGVVAVADVAEPAPEAAEPAEPTADIEAFEFEEPRQAASPPPPDAAPPAAEPPALEPPALAPPPVVIAPPPVVVAPPPAAASAAERAPSQLSRSLATEQARTRADDAGTGPGVSAQLTRTGLRIQNHRAERIVYLVMDSDLAARARWVPCVTPECPGVDPGGAAEVPEASVPGWNESSTVLVFWWHLVPLDEGGLAPDSIRSIPVPYRDE